MSSVFRRHTGTFGPLPAVFPSFFLTASCVACRLFFDISHTLRGNLHRASASPRFVQQGDERDVPGQDGIQWGRREGGGGNKTIRRLLPPAFPQHICRFSSAESVISNVSTTFPFLAFSSSLPVSVSHIHLLLGNNFRLVPVIMGALGSRSQSSTHLFFLSGLFSFTSRRDFMIHEYW